MANLYFREDIAAEAFAAGALVEVTGDEARHAVRVSRLRTGERILVGDGAGLLGEGPVEEVAKDRFAVRVDAVRSHPAPETSLVLVQALAKGDRDERAVEQATEFGPEGGLADEELDALEAAGARILALGSTVLRTSSAGPAALAVLNVALGRW
ncbi:RsmE family RNA methyltransferase [Leucobacter triazinivorans]|uniref:Ribosomal RNA small subunit methyltransferase E n=1 Tax=Leucobacter triazinivorans TaxID=1784719 RepID=A0A4P6KBG1_9MICO|nr:16S rRNA (uracil(1498)-N(3))-methyltransferase [Leucobacter triazinivorans]QBE47423.1 hypothetical protein EVS81_00025 [Leucobacter triazinivorans]